MAKIGDKVNVTLTAAQMQRLGIQSEVKNPCIVEGLYTNGFDGIFCKTAGGATIGVPSKYATPA